MTDIFNKITSSFDWAELWKCEYVTVIPKGRSPSEVSQCRNILCTNFLLKIYESFVLAWAREEVQPKSNQYGGERGCSSAHLSLIHI